MNATKRQIEVNELYHKLNCNSAAVARELELNVTAINKCLFYGARNGLILTPDGYSPVAPAGWSSIFKTVQFNKDGVVQTWDRLKPDEMQIEQFWEFLEKRTPVLPEIIKPPEVFDKNICLEWKLMDHHLGMAGWAKEVGEDYDIKIARDLIIRAAKKIFYKFEYVEKSIIVLGGDNIHADNRSAETERGHNKLDTDTRYAKMVDCIYESMVTAIDIALQRSNKVLIEVLSGNHDYHSAINLARILNAHYRENKRITVDISPALHKFAYWGNTAFMYTHGAIGTDKKFATFFLNYLLEKNKTGIKRKLIRRGHDHKQKKEVPPGLIEEDGVLIEHFPTLAPRDAFAYESAYSNIRATVVEWHHKKYGQVGRRELGILELMEN